IVEEIAEKKPNIVLVALGYPKQEFFIDKYRHNADAIWIGVGGSFDVFSGTKKRAPKAFEADRKSTRLNSSHVSNLYAVFCLKKKYTLKHRHTQADSSIIDLICRVREFYPNGTYGVELY